MGEENLRITLLQGCFVCAYCKTHPEGWTEVTCYFYYFWNASSWSNTGVSPLPRATQPSLPQVLPCPLASLAHCAGDSPIQISPLFYSLAFVLDVGFAKFLLQLPLLTSSNQILFFSPTSHPQNIYRMQTDETPGFCCVERLSVNPSRLYYSSSCHCSTFLLSMKRMRIGQISVGFWDECRATLLPCQNLLFVPQKQYYYEIIFMR